MTDSPNDTCPYREMPTASFWRKAVAALAAHDIDPISKVKFSISVDDKIATAGSCFAQHIARYIQKNGYRYYIAEDAPRFVPEDVRSSWNFGTFSARFGNIYTARQLLQLFERAYGQFAPAESFWEEGGSLVDPFRPHIQPGGYKTVEDLEFDREQHLRCVRSMFESCDVFIFTLGLTEAWIDRRDGAVYPVCPGCGAGIFDPEKYFFVNYKYPDVYADIATFISRLRDVNPGVKIVLTVSPVPLVATATDSHVLAATTYSKSVLRAVAGDIADVIENVQYFPSYEIISAPFNRGRYFGADLREVKQEGVNHVMELFLKHFCTIPSAASGAAQARRQLEQVEDEATMEQIRVICDEEHLEQP